MTLHRLFIYGTLLRGGSNHAKQLQNSGAQWLGSNHTRPAFRLLDFGPFPALLRGGQTSVAGEVLEVTSEVLAKLDQFERCPRLYRRESVNLMDGTQAWAYVMHPDRAATRRSQPIASGVWTQRAAWKA